jgi:hypothetical protein
MYLKPTAGCQISTLIFENKLWRGRSPAMGLRCIIPPRHSDKDPGNTFNINPRWAKTLPSLIYFACDIYRDPLHNLFSNIKVDI